MKKGDRVLVYRFFSQEAVLFTAIVGEINYDDNYTPTGSGQIPLTYEKEVYNNSKFGRSRVKREKYENIINVSGSSEWQKDSLFRKLFGAKLWKQ